MLLSAVLLDLGVDVLHEGVSLHQHVGEGGAEIFLDVVVSKK